MQKLLLEQFAVFWQQREQREQKILIAGAVAIVLALLYSLALNPAMSGIAKLQKSIPLLRQQVAEITLLGTQQAKLSTVLSENVPQVNKESLEAALSRRGIKAQTLSVSDDIVRIQIPSLAYNNLMEWLVEMQKAYRLTVEEARLLALPENGQVSATLTLKQQRNSP